MIKYTVKTTTKFRKDCKLAIKRGLKIELLDQVAESFASGVSLPEKKQDHASGEYHIQPDWLLVYRFEDDVLVLTLTRTGTHSDLFRK